MRTLKSNFKALAAGLALIAGTALAGDATESTYTPWVDGKGQLSLPQDFRLKLAHLSSWYVPEGGASGFHHVYTQPETIEAYRKTGKFPDGAILVKELRDSQKGDYTTGKGVSSPTGTIKQTFLMVKDSQGRFKGNKNWGDGWGWALFKPDNPTVNVSTDYKADCLGCHTPVKDTDWVFIDGYPTLKE